MSGFVSFVSSGPGDPELLTVRAIKRIEAADAVLFDDLSAGPILAHARAGADLVGVGFDSEDLRFLSEGDDVS
jgi:uroporphyrin-III C-methyltransferase